ncbi:MAG: HEAT repeat domain-containing protein [Lentisphaerales bacterium]|nr:HEAT repeat domain-containing protein [Lentisphaerales bacterium]
MLRKLKKITFSLASMAMLCANAETTKLTPTEIEQKAKLRIQNFVKPDGMQMKLWADETQTTNPAAIYFDSKGRLLVTEIHRWRRGVEDIRHHPHMLLEDISINHLSERLGVIKNHLNKGPWSKLDKPMTWFTQYSDKIRLLEDSNNDGRADKATLFADGFNGALEGPGIGVIERDGKVYYTNIPNLWMLEDTDGDGKADTKKSLQEGFGIRMSISGHDMHGMVWGPDGKLYWSLGDRGYSLKTKEGKEFHGPNEGAVFRCNPDGSDVEVFYHRLRNAQELAFDDYGNLFTADNDGDAGDLERYNYLVEGGDSGWHAGQQAIMIFTDNLKFRTAAARGLKSQMSPWMTEGMWKVRHESTPAFMLPGIGQFEGGPSGFVFNPGNSLGERYDNKFFVIHYKGTPSRSSITALDIENEGAGFKVTNQEKFFAGSNCVDVDFGPDGRMYISEFNYGGWNNQNVGNIYSMGFPKELAKPEIKENQQLLTTDFAKLDNSKLYSLLGRDHQQIRLRAQFELAKRGQAGAEQFYKAAFDDSASTFTRIHGIWGLGQMTLNKNYTDLAKLTELLDDKNDQVRIQVARVLGDNRIQAAEQKLIAALSDKHPRVAMYAGIGLGRLQSSKSIAALMSAIKKNNDQDLFLRHGLIMGLSGAKDKSKVTAYAKDQSSAVRLAVLLTLRKSKDSQIAGFLNDPNQKIVNEAIRAISDLPIEGATAQLAAHLDKYIGRDVLVKTDIEKFMQHRLINACYYSATKADAARLLKYAQNKSIPVKQRIEALAAIEAWNDQHPLSNITGLPRPQPSQRADIKDVVLAHADAVIKSAQGEVLAMATRTLEKYGFQLPARILITQALDTKTATAVRLGALKSLVKRKNSSVESVAKSLVNDSQIEMRQLALTALLQVNEKAAIDSALMILKTASVKDKQNTYKLIAKRHDSRIEAFLIKELEKIIKGANQTTTALDGIEAAKLRQESAIKAKLAEYEKSIPVGNAMAKFAPALNGGDIAKGKEIFLNHSGGQCLRCHKVNGFGADVGPDLSSLGKERDRAYILESVIDPGAKVAPGFGIISMTLKNGTAVSGIFQKETDSEIHVKAADGKVTKYSKKEIASKQPPISGMPPMQFLLKPMEVRDVVAYLATLKAKVKKTQGH